LNPTTAPFRISRTFAAPLDLVWRAWADLEQFAQWFGPKGATTSALKRDFKPGGCFHYLIKLPDGQELYGLCVYREILPQTKLVWVNSFSNPAGELARHPFSESWPLEMLTTVTFVPEGGKTTVTVDWLPLNSSEVEIKTFDAGRDSMKGGWTGTFERLDTFLAG
jgi:uncharacterized protein YndB with AHSA1/START domain